MVDTVRLLLGRQFSVSYITVRQSLCLSVFYVSFFTTVDRVVYEINDWIVVVVVSGMQLTIA